MRPSAQKHLTRPPSWQITSFNTVQAAPRSTTPTQSSLAFAFTDPYTRLITNCNRTLPLNSSASIADPSAWTPCRDAAVAFLYDGASLSVNYTFSDNQGLFTTDCGQVAAAGTQLLADTGLQAITSARGNYTVAGRFFVEYTYKETMPASRHAARHCRPRRLGGEDS